MNSINIAHFETNINPVILNYTGNLEFQRMNLKSFGSWFLPLKHGLKNPVSFSSNHDMFMVVSDNYFVDEIFEKIKDTRVNEIESFELSSASSYEFVSYLKFIDAYLTFDGEGAPSVDVIDLDAEDLTKDNFFHIQFLDADKLQIVKRNINDRYFLTYDESDDVQFAHLSSVEAGSLETEMVYSFNSETNKLLLIFPNKGVVKMTQDNISIVPMSSDTVDRDFLIEVVNTNFLENKISLKRSFLPQYSFKNKSNITYPVDNMGLITHNTRSLNDNSNYIQLKSNVVYDEEYSHVNNRGRAFFRKYSSVNTGMRGDGGYNNIVLSYNTEDYKIEFKGDQLTYFNIPHSMGRLNRLNINETNLIQNGAFAGNSPMNSDKVYKKLFEYPDFTNTGNIPDVATGRYLCTWFWYNPSFPLQSLWLDRYYNPDETTQLDALSEDGWNFLEGLESFHRTHGYLKEYKDYYKEFDKEKGVFDVVSRMTFDENALYAYFHFGKISSKKLLDLDVEKNILELNDFKADHENIEVLSLEHKSTNVPEYSINVVLDEFYPDKVKGNQIFGNDSLNLTIDPRFTPYHVSISGNRVLVFDYNYNPIEEIQINDTGVDIIKLVPTDHWNLFFVLDEDNYIYTISKARHVTNVGAELSSFNLSAFEEDIVYNPDNRLLYVITEGDGVDEVYSYDYLTDDLNLETEELSGDLLYFNRFGNLETRFGSKLDLNRSSEVYSLSSGNVFFEDVLEPVVIAEDGDIRDFYVFDRDIYVLRPNKLFKVRDDIFIEMEKSVEITTNVDWEKIIPVRILEGGEIKEYVDIVGRVFDEGNENVLRIRRYDKSLEFVGEMEKFVPGEIQNVNSLFHTKYDENELKFNIVLFNLIDYGKREFVTLKIPKDFIEEDLKSVLNIVVSNRFGNIGVYLNGRLVVNHTFDPDKYYFSNTLRDTKLIFSASPYGENQIINDVFENSDTSKIMVSGGYEIKHFSIYEKAFDYFDVINFNRIYRDNISANLIVPIKERGFVEEIGGMFIQNKNLRKSEFGSIKVFGGDLTDEMKKDIENFSNKLYDDTYVNLKLDSMEFE